MFSRAASLLAGPISWMLVTGNFALGRGNGQRQGGHTSIVYCDGVLNFKKVPFKQPRKNQVSF